MIGVAKKGDDLLREAMRRLSQLGGKARIAKLTPAQRTALARKAGKASGAARRKKAEGLYTVESGRYVANRPFVLPTRLGNGGT